MNVYGNINKQHVNKFTSEPIQPLHQLLLEEL